MIRQLVFLVSLICFSAGVSAQENLARERWFEVSTDNFQVLSQLSRGQTEERALALERWRSVALQILGRDESLVQDPVLTHIYLFDNEEDLRAFSDSPEASFFYPAPRANFLAVGESDDSQSEALHQYSHFLINNQPHGLPRWYEEGMSKYLSRVSVDDDNARMPDLLTSDLELMLAVNESLSLDELLHDDSALASPRQIQIANHKAGIFMHFLLHAHEREDFLDRRLQLQAYVDLLQAGRNLRFAYDQAFDISLAALEREFLRYVQLAAQARQSDRVLFVLEGFEPFDGEQSDEEFVALGLGELALHAGKFELAELYFGMLVNQRSPIGRAYSGYADALRMRASVEGDSLPDVLSLYQEALLLEADDPQLSLDYGQFLETELNSCERVYSDTERMNMRAEMREQFSNALRLGPESPEANLSFAQIFLQEEESWQEGLPYQEKAFAARAADSFVMEQAIAYAIAAENYEQARTLIARLSRPLHTWGTPYWISELSIKLEAAERRQPFDPCANAGI
jgi:hypothetical protein